MAFARIVLPPAVAKGQPVEVRLSIRHPMETGFRVDDSGHSIPRNTIRELVARYGGVEVLRASLGSGVAANAYLRFFLTAEASGPLVLDWIDDAGEAGSATAEVKVVG